MKNKKFMVLLVLSFLFLLVVGSMYSYSLYISKTEQAIEMRVANWDILVNDSMVTDGGEETKTFTINDMTLTGAGAHVEEGLFAPGVSGSFTLAIDPYDTEVSFVYDLTVDSSNIKNDRITITEVSKVDKYGNLIDGGFLKNIDSEKGIYEDTVYYDKNTYLKPKEDRCIYIRITISWLNDENNNVADTEVGMNGDQPKLDIPIKVNFRQYVG